jgi:hypothetical protein
MSNDPLYHELLAACLQPGCPVCRVVQASLEHTLRSFFYESVNDRGLRAELRRSLGFCREHTWLALEPGLGDALGVAILYNDVFKTVLRRLPHPSDSASKGGLASLLGQVQRQFAEKVKAARLALTATAPCPICLQSETSTRLALNALVTHLVDPVLPDALRASEGLCLPHLRSALGAAPGEEQVDALLSISRSRLEALQVELEELIRKNDYRFRDEPSGSERDAWLRAARLAVGERPVKPA